MNKLLLESCKERTLGLLIFCFFAFAFLAGCGQPKRIETVEQICLPELEKQRAMQVARQVLSSMHFTIEKFDTDTGFIRTRPLAAAQFFEFWRRDNVGAYNFALANLHSIRRTVELNIYPVNQGKLCIDCKVKVQRLSLAGHQVISGQQAYRTFSKTCPSIRKLKLATRPAANFVWVDLGEDKQLTTEILEQISSLLDTR